MIVLAKEHYQKILPLLDEVSINNLFARAVLERKVDGTVYADETTHPKTVYIVHSYGMTLLAGDPSNKKFNAAFRDYTLGRNKIEDATEWMQAFPFSWNKVLDELFEGHVVRSSENKEGRWDLIELNTRVNFKFNPPLYQFREPVDPSITVVRTDEKMFHEMKGSVIPSLFWDSAERFLNEGAGYSVLVNGQLAAMAFSSCRYNNQLELGIETAPAFRGRGLAEYACSALINFCLQKQFEPVWACRQENTGSYKLALKLGFEVSCTLPYYRLCR